MKTANLMSILALACAILLLGSCAAYGGAPITTPAGISGAPHPMWGNHLRGNDCSHQQNYTGGMSGTYPFSMRSDYYAFCHKCGRYVRGRQ